MSLNDHPSAQRKSKSMKYLYKSRISPRMPSRQFNDPIYAGFEMNEQNSQHINWGPWIISNQTMHLGSHSLHSNLSIKKSMQSQFSSKSKILPIKVQNQIHENQRNTFILGELPSIKQKCKPSLFQLKIGIEKCQLALKNNSPRKNQTRFRVRQKSNNIVKQRYERRPIQINSNKLKLGTVVYNYCTNNYADECILDYHRKSEQLLSRFPKSLQQQMHTTKFQGLRSYWSKINKHKRIS